MLVFNRKYINLINGETYAYIEKGTGKETILLIHGNLASSVHMVTLMDELKSDYRIIAPDLRGFGESSFIHEFTSLKELAFDLTLFLEELNIKQVHVIGWSTGFGVAMELAILNPNLVQSLFSLEGMSVKGYYSEQRKREVFQSFSQMKKDKALKFIPDALKRKDYKLIESVWTKTLLKSELPHPLLKTYVEETLKQRCQMHINWCWVNFNISDEANLYTKGNSRMHDIKCPIHITLALQDNVVTPQMIMENIESFKNAKVYTFENAGHCLHFDALNEVALLIKKHI